MIKEAEILFFHVMIMYRFRLIWFLYAMSEVMLHMSGFHTNDQPAHLNEKSLSVCGAHMPVFDA